MGYLEVEVFTPGASQHIVEPLDANNVSWQNPLLPALYLGPLSQADLPAQASIFALGFSVVVLAIYMAKKMQLISDSLTSGKKSWASSVGSATTIHTDQVRSSVNRFLSDCDLSNHIA